jgi:hypothetical protein
MTGDARIRELLLVNVFAVFKERDPVRRKNAIVANYTDDVVWSGHDGTTHGHKELNEGAQRPLDRTPTFVFTAAGPVQVLSDLGSLAFNLGVPEQPPASSGADVAIGREGKIAVLSTGSQTTGRSALVLDRGWRWPSVLGGPRPRATRTTR